MEGALTVILVPLFFFLFPKTPEAAWFLTDEEKVLMKQRFETDLHWGFEEEFSWQEVSKAFIDPKWYAFWVYQFCCDISLYGLTTFMPAIVQGLGYTSVHANLMTVPIFMVSLVCFLVIAYFSDRSGVRGPFLMGALLSLIIVSKDPLQQTSYVWAYRRHVHLSKC